MRSYPIEDYELKDLERLNAPTWMTDLLKLNPEYTCWGPHEDYMCDKGQWNSPQINETWEDFGPWELDDYNECVNFYFEINRESQDCPVCGGNGYNPDAQWVSESFYQHSSPFFTSYPDKATLNKYNNAFHQFCKDMKRIVAWNDKIVQEELDVLFEEGRLGKEKPSLKEVNDGQQMGIRNNWGHDAINRSILIRKRCERFGIPVECDECKGHGYVYTAPEAHLSLILWILHPRKGASRGVEIKHVEKENLPGVFKFLKDAAERNAARFEKIK